ncbi:nuclease [Phenylobacterium sp.]|uniref:nuclease n=1 Tax=Phenylobacterium sp. TaxID=1871053 RepID=UPI0008C44EBA|nr:nuclease [Phenylobacterium sp.]MBA4794589.1 nuclease [Phenylobacterium sp.]OHB37315.1 MAG: hypothetical protein A2882_05645 [Phenylobacterium sp. RIFCSPHIGHO2_01_FULL_70_10]
MRILMSAFAAAGSLALASCGPPASIFSDGASALPAHDLLVVEADTLVIDGQRIRLANAVAPKAPPFAGCWAEAVAAREARAAAEELLAQAYDIRLATTARAAPDGSPLAQVALDGEDLGQALIERGLAVRRASEPFQWCAPVDMARMSDPYLASPWKQPAAFAGNGAP